VTPEEQMVASNHLSIGSFHPHCSRVERGGKQQQKACESPTPYCLVALKTRLTLRDEVGDEGPSG